MVLRFCPYRVDFRARRISRFASLLCAAGFLMAGGCALVDQRTFDASAGRPPVPHYPPAKPGPPPVAPFLQIMAGTPETDWRPVVARSVRVALSRKPDVLFIVTAISPVQGSPERQVKALGDLAEGDGRVVADAIIAAGAAPLQVQMMAEANPGDGAARVRVDAR